LEDVTGLEHESQAPREVDWLLNSIGVTFIGCSLEGDGVWTMRGHCQVKGRPSRFESTSFVVIDPVDQTHVFGHGVAVLSGGSEKRQSEKEEKKSTQETYKVWWAERVLHDHPTMREDHEISNSCARFI
jgi:hypothetical protein